MSYPLSTIKIVGIGGAGCNFTTHMQQTRLFSKDKVEYIAMNTNQAALNSQPDYLKIHLELVQPQAGQTKAKNRLTAKCRRDIKKVLGKAKTVVLVSGLGGNCGTDCTLIIAKLTKALVPLVVCAVTLPFSFEGQKRRDLAQIGLLQLQHTIYKITVFENDRLLVGNDRNASLKEYFDWGAEIFCQELKKSLINMTIISMVPNAAILRAFPNNYEFRFDDSRQNLLIYDHNKLKLLAIKTNIISEIFASEQHLQLFCFSPDSAYVYVMYSLVDRQENTSQILKINTKTLQICDSLISPLGEGNALIFSKNKLIIYGKRYQLFVDTDSHEMFIPYAARFHWNSPDSPNQLESKVDQDEYQETVRSYQDYEKFHYLPKEVRITMDYNDETAFWDDTRNCDLHILQERRQSIPNEQLLSAIAVDTNFPCYALKSYEEFALLVGYEMDF